MNRRYENKSAADELSLERLKSNPEAVQLVPVLAEDIAELQSLINSRKESMKRFAALASATSVEKKNSQITLIDNLDRLLGKVHRYGNRSGNAALAEQTDLHRSDLEAMRDGDVLRFSQNFLDSIKSIADKLVSHGVKKEMIEAVTTSIDHFDEKKGEVAGDGIDKSSARKSIAKTTVAINELFIKSIDPLIRSMRQDLPEFCEEYFASRPVHNRGVRHRKPPVNNNNNAKPEQPVNPGKPASA